MSLLLYLHGFNSSSNSEKANLFKSEVKKKWDNVQFFAPQLPCYPLDVVHLLERIIEQYNGQKIGVVGSSLGGFFATWLSQTYRIPAVLINPLIYPQKLAPLFLGEHNNPYTEQYYEITQTHLDDLYRLAVYPILDPSLIFLLQQKGDELLDYRQADEVFYQSKHVLEEGGNHYFQGIERHFPAIFSFLSLYE